MSTIRSINLVTRKGTTIRPVKGVTQTEHMTLENPEMKALKRYTDAGWEIKFETFQVIQANNGIKKYHFLRLEKPIEVYAPIFKPEMRS